MLRRVLKPRRGASIIEALLLVAVLGAILISGNRWMEAHTFEIRTQRVGNQLAVLAEAVENYVNAGFGTVVAAVSTPQEIPLADLRAADVLAVDFPDRGAFGRRLRVLARSAGVGVVEVLVTQELETGDALLPSAAIADASGLARLGQVVSTTATRIVGPAINTDVSAFQAAFAGVPQVGALATLRRFDHDSVCGEHLYRVAVPGCPNANTMATGLDMGGNDVVNAGTVTVTSLKVENDLVAEGNIEAARELIVGTAVRVSGAADFEGAVTAESGRVTGALTAGNMRVSQELRAQSAVVSGAATAESVAAIGVLSAGSAEVTDLQTQDLNVSGRATANSVEATTVTAHSVEVSDQIDAADGGFTSLVVGVCVGC